MENTSTNSILVIGNSCKTHPKTIGVIAQHKDSVVIYVDDVEKTQRDILNQVKLALKVTSLDAETKARCKFLLGNNPLPDSDVVTHELTYSEEPPILNLPRDKRYIKRRNNIPVNKRGYRMGIGFDKETSEVKHFDTFKDSKGVTYSRNTNGSFSKVG